MPTPPASERFQATLAFVLVALVVALAVDPGGGVWRLPAGAVAAILALELWRRGRQRQAARRVFAEGDRRPTSLLSTGLYDPLTRLPNRTLLNELLEKQAAQAQRSGYRMGVVVCDIDRFKSFNDSLGPAAADRLLRHLARRFQGQIRQSDTLARTGGDAFTLLVAKVDRAEEVTLAARRVLATLRGPFTIDGEELLVSASAGLSVYPDDAADPALLLSHAEEALARAKSQGGNSLQLYAPSMNRRSREQAVLEQELRRAIAEGSLSVHYQPQVSLADGAIVGLEALVRWPHPEHGLMAAGRFIPLAEGAGLMRDLGAWLIDEICRQSREWADRGLPTVPVSVNVSIRQFQAGDVAAVVAAALETTGIDPGLLQVEITESVAMQEDERISESLSRLQELGVKIHLDDFGTGYSSLSYLLRYPVDVLKIDRSFVDGVTRSDESDKIVKLTIALAKSLDLDLIAEGVETPAQLAFLRREGCPAAQGFLLARPGPTAEVERLLASGVIEIEPMLAG